MRADLSGSEYRKAVFRKLGLLYDHYQIADGEPSDRLAVLAIALAFAHVPGFRSAGQVLPGRPVDWTKEDLRLLYFRVEAEKLQSRCSARKAVHQIAGVNYRQTPERLYRVYVDAKAEFGKNGFPTAMDEWIAEVKPRGALP